MNDQKRKSSCMHDLCAGLVLFRLRSKELSPVCTGIVILFVDCHRSDNQFQETPKHDLASFCAQWTQKRGPKPLQNLRGVANLQFKNLGFLGLNKIRMRSLVPRERNNLEDAQFFCGFTGTIIHS